MQLSLFKLTSLISRKTKILINSVRPSFTNSKSTKKQKSKIKSLKKINLKITLENSVELRHLWLTLRASFFPERLDLDNYQISWSKRRQKRTLASCHVRKRIVHVAKEMNSDEARKFLSPLIFHEMCHAVLGENITKKGSKRLWHGPQFKALEILHPETPLLDQWIRSGGWLKAVRSTRTKDYHQKRKLEVTLQSGEDF
ncbi:MAG: SprT-like domain-containing protein [bacterium]|nr:SprT-like domain-containing protein [bacterium]